MDTTDQKLAQALHREVHLQMSLDAERRCNGSLRAERDQLKQAVDFLSRVAAELTIAKQETANALHEQRSAVTVIERYRDRSNWRLVQSYTAWIGGNGYDPAEKWLTQQGYPPSVEQWCKVLDPEAEAEQALEHIED